MNALEQKQEERAAKQKAWMEIYDSKPERDFTADELADLQTRNIELKDLGDQIVALSNAEESAELNRKALEMYERPTPKVAHGGDIPTDRNESEFKHLGRIVTESLEYKNRRHFNGNFTINLPGFSMTDYIGRKGQVLIDRKGLVVPMEYKTLMTTAAGFAPENPRSGDVVPYARWNPRIADYIPSYQTTNKITKWMEKTTDTRNSAATAEGSAPTDSAAAYTEQSATVEKITGWLPVTEEELDDVLGLEATINADLMGEVRLTEETQILTGTGTTPQLNGLITAATSTAAKGTDSEPDAIHKAMTVVAYTGMANPSLIVMHPNDWQQVALLQDANGNYIWGSPAAQAGQPRSMWGVPVYVTPNLTENTVIVADTGYLRVARHGGVVIASSDSHSTYFTEGKKAIKATEHIALEVRRVAALYKITAF